MQDNLHAECHNYLMHKLTDYDKKQIITTYDKDTKIINTQSLTNIDLSKFWWSEDIANEVRTIIDKPKVYRSEYEQAMYDEAFKIYFDYYDDSTNFVDWINYVRFVETFTPDFFGFD